MIQAMRPFSAGFYEADCSLVDTICTRYARLRFASREAQAYLCDLRERELLARDAPAISVGVERVLASRVVPQIDEPIIGWIAVVMAAFHAIWARADECEHDETVNEHPASLAVAAENEGEVADSAISPGPQNPPRLPPAAFCFTAHPPKVGDGIQLIPSWDRAPLLIHGRS